MIENKSFTSRIRVCLIYLLVILAGLICLFPLWNTVCFSFSSSAAITANKVTLLPVDFNMDSYKELLKDQQFWRSAWISVQRVVLGWTLNIFLIVTMAYPLTRSNEEFRGRNIYMGLLLFVMLFSGGTVPHFILVKNLGLLNSIGALFLTGAVPVFHVIMVKNFFLGIPKSLEEAARIDGANPIQVLLKVYLPCSKPVLATVSLFSIVGHWNDYYKGMLYATKIEHYPIMTYIRGVSVNLQKLIDGGASEEEIAAAANINAIGLNSAKIVVATIPLLLIYPFLQKYLITGITIGAVKE